MIIMAYQKLCYLGFVISFKITMKPPNLLLMRSANHVTASRVFANACNSNYGSDTYISNSNSVLYLSYVELAYTKDWRFHLFL